MGFKVFGPTALDRDGKLWMAISQLLGGVEVPDWCPCTETGGGYNRTSGVPDPPDNPKPTPLHPYLGAGWLWSHGDVASGAQKSHFPVMGASLCPNTLLYPPKYPPNLVG